MCRQFLKTPSLTSVVRHPAKVENYCSKTTQKVEVNYIQKVVVLPAILPNRRTRTIPPESLSPEFNLKYEASGVEEQKLEWITHKAKL